MSEQIILDLPAFLGWSFLVLVNGMFFGCGVYAFCCEVGNQAGWKPRNYDKSQAEADELWAATKARSR
ncbi:hypothetical protein CN138_09040 [Sinorhizobium meliloti]|uniref:hypothetical protein n=1 Tax=Rhizobium meliloti TaxID=382 RepID=UPI000FD7C60B|nr:hypothetical protein [Sinorhizobium meliloti]RVL72399.1 hypothetical protein CN138_09040 [Sinorhizobium meliloti]